MPTSMIKEAITHDPSIAEVVPFSPSLGDGTAAKNAIDIFIARVRAFFPEYAKEYLTYCANKFSIDLWQFFQNYSTFKTTTVQGDEIDISSYLQFTKTMRSEFVKSPKSFLDYSKKLLESRLPSLISKIESGKLAFSESEKQHVLDYLHSVYKDLERIRNDYLSRRNGKNQSMYYYKAMLNDIKTSGSFQSVIDSEIEVGSLALYLSEKSGEFESGGYARFMLSEESDEGFSDTIQSLKEDSKKNIGKLKIHYQDVGIVEDIFDNYPFIAGLTGITLDDVLYGVAGLRTLKKKLIEVIDNLKSSSEVSKQEILRQDNLKDTPSETDSLLEDILSLDVIDKEENTSLNINSPLAKYQKYLKKFKGVDFNEKTVEQILNELRKVREPARKRKQDVVKVLGWIRGKDPSVNLSENEVEKESNYKDFSIRLAASEIVWAYCEEVSVSGDSVTSLNKYFLLPQYHLLPYDTTKSSKLLEIEYKVAQQILDMEQESKLLELMFKILE